MEHGWRKIVGALTAVALLALGAWASEVGAAVPAGMKVEVTADFESLTPNQMVKTLTTGGGGLVATGGGGVTGAVTVVGVTTNPPRDDNRAAVFNATCLPRTKPRCGGDRDLYQPQQGNVLITDRVGDQDGNGFVDASSGANDANGHILSLDFTGFGSGTITPKSITVLDIDDEEAAANVKFIAGDAVLDTVAIPVTGDGGIVTVDLTGKGAGAERMVVTFPNSGAIDDVVFDVDVECVAPGERSAASTATAVHLAVPGLELDLTLPDPATATAGTDETDGDVQQLADIDELDGLVTAKLLEATADAGGTEPANAAAASTVADIDIGDGLITVGAVISRAHTQATEFGAFGSTLASKVDDVAISGLPLIDVDEIIGLDASVPLLDLGEIALYDREVSDELTDGRWIGSASMTALRITVFDDAFPVDSPLALLNGLLLEVGTTTATASAAANPCESDTTALLDASARIAGVDLGQVPINVGAGIFVPEFAVGAGVLTAGPIAPAGHDFGQALGFTVDGVAGGGIGVVEAEGVFDGVNGIADGRAELARLDLFGGEITADLLSSWVTATDDESGDASSEGGASFAALTLPGWGNVCALPFATAQPGGTCTVPPNTELVIGVADTSLVTIVLNHQIDNSTGLQTGPPGFGCAEVGDVADCTVRAVTLRTGLDVLGLASQIVLVESQASAAVPAP